MSDLSQNQWLRNCFQRLLDNQVIVDNKLNELREKIDSVLNREPDFISGFVTCENEEGKNVICITGDKCYSDKPMNDWNKRYKVYLEEIK